MARQKLANDTTARLEAEILMAHVLQSSRSFLYANPELELPNKRVEVFKKLVKQRVLGHPIAYLTGSSEFWSLPLAVSPAVLIPRAETELLVETALERIPENADWRIADLGTGSGAIALALAAERKKCEIHATDNSKSVLEIATENARKHGLETVRFHHGSWCQALQGKFHLLLSNPPYIDAQDPHLQQGDLRFEPRTALTLGADGLHAIREISRFAKPLLVDGGCLMFEHSWKQGPAVREIMTSTGFENIATLSDLQGHERVSMGECRL